MTTATSPYLNRRLRTYEEVKAARERNPKPWERNEDALIERLDNERRQDLLAAIERGYRQRMRLYPYHTEAQS